MPFILCNVVPIIFPSFQSLIEQCWTHDPDKRITFCEINKYLQQNVSTFFGYFMTSKGH